MKRLFFRKISGEPFCLFYFCKYIAKLIYNGLRDLKKILKGQEIYE